MQQPALPDLSKLNQYMSFHFDPNSYYSNMSITEQMVPIPWAQTPIEFLKNEESPLLGLKLNKFAIDYIRVYFQFLHLYSKIAIWSTVSPIHQGYQKKLMAQTGKTT